MDWLVILLVALAAYGIGLLQNGINITITKKPHTPESPKDGYATSTEDLLAPEIREYLEKHNGMINL